MKKYTLESDFEKDVVSKLQACGWKGGANYPAVLHYPTEAELIQNWANIIFEHNRKELNNLINDIQQDKINRLFITYKDRLTRFGFNYLQEICKFHNTEIIQISNEIVEKSLHQDELVEDLISIIYSFSGKLYGLSKSQLKEINNSLNNLSIDKDEV